MNFLTNFVYTGFRQRPLTNFEFSVQFFQRASLGYFDFVLIPDWILKWIKSGKSVEQNDEEETPHAFRSVDIHDDEEIELGDDTSLCTSKLSH